MGPETSMEVQAALGTDIALAFDECTPFHATRDYTQRSMERTHRWLERCVRWHEGELERAGPAAGRASSGPGVAGGPPAEGGPRRLLFGIVQGGVHEDLRDEAARTVAVARVDGVAIGGTLGRDKQQMREVVDWSLRPLPEERPRHLLGIGDPDDVVRSVRTGIDIFDCATPTRLARHGTALVPDPGSRFRLDLAKPDSAESRAPVLAGCPCPACREHTRAYLHHLARAKELTGARLLTLHNLTFMERLMERLREAIRADRLDALESALMRGEAPYSVLS
jgi:queuine tRNA-ribosyltransferase